MKNWPMATYTWALAVVAAVQVDVDLAVVMMDTVDPFSLFKEWYEEAKSSEPSFPDAMVLATVSEEGFPAARIVLMKDYSEEGFIFYTNLKGQKGQEIQKNPKVCLNFHWKSLQKQVRIQGIARPVSGHVADKYFASRPHLSKIGAWASKQSQIMSDRFALEKRVALFTAKFALTDVPRPEFWSGFCVEPTLIEFWHEKPFRLHDRFTYTREEGKWVTHHLFP